MATVRSTPHRLRAPPRPYVGTARLLPQPTNTEAPLPTKEEEGRTETGLFSLAVQVLQRGARGLLRSVAQHRVHVVIHLVDQGIQIHIIA